MYDVEIRKSVRKKLDQMIKKDLSSFDNIEKKITQIRNNPHKSYKNLKVPLHSFNRVHVNKSFVVVFRIDHDLETIEIWNYDHHDNVYKWRPRPEDE